MHQPGKIILSAGDLFHSQERLRASAGYAEDVKQILSLNVGHEVLHEWFEQHKTELPTIYTATIEANRKLLQLNDPEDYQTDLGEGMYSAFGHELYLYADRQKLRQDVLVIEETLNKK